MSLTISAMVALIAIWQLPEGLNFWLSMLLCVVLCQTILKPRQHFDSAIV